MTKLVYRGVAYRPGKNNTTRKEKREFNYRLNTYVAAV